MNSAGDILKLLTNSKPWLYDSGLKILAIVLITILLRRYSTIIIEKSVRKLISANQYGSKKAERQREDTLIRIFETAAKVIISIVAIITILSELGIDTGPLIAGAGILGIAAGFGGQYLVRDIITGFFIILENQYRVGDVVCIGNICGGVEDITLRMTILRDSEGTVHHIPNGEIKIASNKSKGFAKANIQVTVSYDENIDKVKRVINRVGRALAKDKIWEEHIRQAPKFVRVSNFTDSGVQINISCETEPLKQWEIAGVLRKKILEEFGKENIVFPYPHRTIQQIRTDD